MTLSHDPTTAPSYDVDFCSDDVVLNPYPHFRLVQWLHSERTNEPGNQRHHVVYRWR
jgi:hypothetical protein